MSKPTKLRKPPQFVAQGLIVAWCEYNGVVRMVNTYSITLLPTQVRRFSAWLARAQAWVEDKKGGG